MAIPIITEQDFEREVLRSKLPVLVNFYADGLRSAKQLHRRSRLLQENSMARPKW